MGQLINLVQHKLNSIKLIQFMQFFPELLSIKFISIIIKIFLQIAIVTNKF